MILVTGPTGSGKSTTLYAAVSTINSPEINILTAEDPVEYKLPRIKQVHVREDIGLSFTTALRSFLRQDPDVILVGEMRDAETAQIAIRAALTGHLVFSTLHTNDAPSTVTRLLEMGVAPFLATTVSMGTLLDLRFKPEETAELKLQAGRGCTTCAGTGYPCRTFVAEFLEITPDIQEAVIERRSAHGAVPPDRPASSNALRVWKSARSALEAGAELGRAGPSRRGRLTDPGDPGLRRPWGNPASHFSRTS